MSASSFAILGTNRLAEEILGLCRAKGLRASHHREPETVDSSATLVVETLAGTEEEKRRNLQGLEKKLQPGAVIVSSCLGFSVTRIGSWTSSPQRVAGFATFYPMDGKNVIEVAAGLRTEAQSLNRAEEFFRELGKDTVCVKDAPGLVFPRILSLIINEAARSLDEGVAAAEEIDEALRLGTNYPQGPLRWADQTGLDEVLSVLEGLRDETGDDRYRPSPLLKRLVLAGRLGESSGEGFYRYDRPR